MRYTQWHSSRS